METNDEVIVKEPYGFIYITTNMVNGMRYLGQKKFDKSWKNYLGSGAILKRAIKKYGKENFSRNIIYLCDSPEESNKVEYDLSVFFNVVEDDNWYNLCYGGGSINGFHFSEESKNKISQSNKGKIKSEENRKNISERMKGEKNYFYGKHYCGKNHPNYGKPMSEELKQKLRESKQGMYVGEKNPKAKALIQLTLENEFIKEWPYCLKASKELNISPPAISRCINHIQNSAGGYKWILKEEYEQQLNIQKDLTNSENNDMLTKQND